MTMTTGTSPQLLWPGINANFGLKYNEHMAQYPYLYDTFPSTKAYEEDVQHNGLGLAPIKPEGEATKYQDMKQGFTSRYTHATVSLGYIITEEAESDLQYKEMAYQYNARLARSMNQTKEIIGAGPYNRAFNDAYLGGDGVELIAEDHPSPGGEWSNGLFPAANFSEVALEDMLIQIKEAEDSVAQKINIAGKVLIVPPALMFDAERVMKSTLRSNSANNDINALKEMSLLPGGVVVNNYLTDQNAWFVRTDAPDGMKCFKRWDIAFTEDNETDTGNHKYKARERYSFKWSDPRGLYGSAGA